MSSGKEELEIGQSRKTILFKCELKIIWTPMCCISSTGVLLGHHVSDWRLSKTFDAKNDNKAKGLSSHCLFTL